MRILSLFLVSSLGLASGLKSPRQYTSGSSSEPLSSSSSAVLNIRGGAGPLDPTLVAKTATVLVGAQGLVKVFCTEANLKKYGVTSATEEDVLLSKMTGVVQTSSAILPGLLLFYGTDATTGIAYSFVPFILWFLTGLINEVPKKMGIRESGYKVWSVINSATMYGLLKGTDWADNVYKGVLGLSTIFYLINRVSPAKAVEIWGKKEPLSALSTTGLKNNGDIGLSLCVMAYFLYSGTDTLTSIGYGWAVSTVGMAYSLFVSKDFEAAKIDTSKFLGWLVLSLIIVGTLVA